MIDWFNSSGARQRRWQALALLVAGLALVLAGCGGKGKRRGHRGRGKGKRILTVHVKTVTESTLSNDIVATGTTQPAREMYLSTQVGGSLIRLSVALGKKVKKGQVLAQVSSVGLYGESRQAAAEIKRLKSDIEQAKTELKDTKRLFEQKIVSRKNYDDARYKLLRLQAQRSQAKARLGAVGERFVGGVVRAPFAGIIAAQNAEVGDYVAPGKVIGHLVDLRTIKVVVSLAEVDMVQLKRDMPAKVSFGALGERVWPGRIIAVAPTADKLTGAFPVEVLIDNADGALRGGMAAQVVFGRPGIRGIFVPVEAVVRRGGRPVAYVLAASGDKVQMRQCKVGLARDGMVQILSGLKVGDRLVVSGNTRLRDGSKVRVAGAGRPGAMGGPRAAPEQTASSRRPAPAKEGSGMSTTPPTPGAGMGRSATK